MAGGLVAPSAIEAADSLFPKLEYSHSFALFLIAIAGWMPTSPSASFFLSAWSAQRRADLGAERSVRDAAFDFNFGYALTLLLALAFVLLGAVVLFSANVTPETRSAIQFAGTFVRLFTDTFGPWAYMLMGGMAFILLFTTMLTLFDGAPRVMRSAVGASLTDRRTFLVLFGVQLLGVLLIIQFFAGSFGTFIDFAAGLGFATAPFIAFLNHKAISSADTSQAVRPGIILTLWNYAAILVFTVIAAYFFLSGFGG